MSVRARGPSPDKRRGVPPAPKRGVGLSGFRCQGAPRGRRSPAGSIIATGPRNLLAGPEVAGEKVAAARSRPQPRVDFALASCAELPEETFQVA